MESTSVVLVHDHALFREGLRQNIQTTPDFYIIGEASNGQQAIQLVEQTDPGMLVIELDLPGISGLEVSWVIKRAHPHIGIVLLGDTMTGSQVIKVIRSGVAGYLRRNVSWEVLLNTMRRVRRGDYPINDLLLELPEVASQVLTAFRQTEMDRDTQNIYSPLSSRELQVLELVATGQTNKEIAQALDISNQTVKNHISSILRKLAVNDRMQAVFYALSRGWIKEISTDPARLERDEL
jgi:DNA-binding NarL/FixJ family response regulator